MLQRSAAYFNTVQHVAPQYGMLQHSAASCNAVQQVATQCSMLDQAMWPSHCTAHRYGARVTAFDPRTAVFIRV
jgi:hypothetical protein